MKKNEAWFLGRRAELLAQEFLHDLGAEAVSTVSIDVGFDYLAFFADRKHGTKVIAVEVKATESSVEPGFRVRSSLVSRLKMSNLPGLLLVIDVKSNKNYFSWVSGPDSQDVPEPSTSNSVIVPVKQATPTECERLVSQILAL